MVILMETIWNCTSIVIFYISDIYDKARQKLREAEERSDINSTADEPVDERPRRKLR